MSELITAIIVTALGSSLVTALGFMVTFNARFARVETTLRHVSNQLEEHIKLSPDVGRIDERVTGLERRMNKEEAKLGGG